MTKLKFKTFELLIAYILTLYNDFQLHISKGAFKLEGINSLNTNTLTNDYCIKQNKKGINIICNWCYSFTLLQGFRSNMVKLLEKNSLLLSLFVIPDNFVLIVYVTIFRFHSHGELHNETHLINLINICNKNKHCTFTLWTKRNDLIKKYFDKNIKPKNLILVYSNPKINHILNKIPKYFDKTFNNINNVINVNDNDNRFIAYKNKRMQSKKYKELFKQNDFKLIDKYILNVKKTYAKKYNLIINAKSFLKDNENINCFSKCIDCLKCYKVQDKTKHIIEQVK
jgi:hypothetical protein